MTERFKQYLEAAFRKIKPTKAAMEYRKETLVKLEELAQDFRIKGMTDDEAIYKLCIDSLGDFDKTLADFDRALVEVPKKNTLKRNIATAVVASVAVIIALYLVLSITTVQYRYGRYGIRIPISRHRTYRSSALLLDDLPCDGDSRPARRHSYRIYHKEQTHHSRIFRMADTDQRIAVRHARSRRRDALASRLAAARADIDRRRSHWNRHTRKHKQKKQVRNGT